MVPVSLIIKKLLRLLHQKHSGLLELKNNSATALDAVKTEMNDSTGRWSYAEMQYGHVFTTLRGNTESLVTFGNTRNDQHTTVFGIEEKNAEPAYIVTGAVLGRIAGFITNDPARPVQTGELIGNAAKYGKAF